LFKDVSKKANDILKKEFVSNHEFEIRNRTTNGLEFTTTGKRNNVGFDIDFEVEYNDRPAGLKVRERLNNDKDMTLEVSLANKLVDGLRVGVESVTTTGKPKSLTGTIEYSNKSTISQLVVDLQKTTVDASTVVAYENFLLGAKTQIDPAKPGVSNAECVVGYTTKDFTVTAGVNSAKEEATGTYVYRLASLPDATLAGSYTFKTTNSSSTFAVGGSYRCDATATVKGKIESNGTLSLLYTQKMNDNLTLGLGTSIKTGQLGAANSQEVGVSLKYSS